MTANLAPPAATLSVSSVLSRRRASPSAYATSRCAAAGSSPAIASAACALVMICSRSSLDRGCSTYTTARDKSAELTSNDGFSVVAPTKVNSPLSTCGKKASCWLLLKRCTSSTNTIVWRPCAAATLAISTASRMSLTPPSTALMETKRASNASAIRRASVVLPVPGGPHRMQLCGIPLSKATRKDCPSPTSCCWPITSASVRGRKRSASGTRTAACTMVLAAIGGSRQRPPVA